MQITKNAVALIEYELTNDEGEVIDTSKEGGPIAYLHGTGNLVPGLELELEGKGSGDEFKVRITPEDGYGERSEEMIQDVPRTQFPPDAEIEPGMQFQAEGPEGARIVTIIEVADETVKLDANHPLAGIHLSFEVKIVEVREATAEELEHGHVHGAGGHQH